MKHTSFRLGKSICIFKFPSYIFVCPLSNELLTLVSTVELYDNCSLTMSKNH